MTEYTEEQKAEIRQLMFARDGESVLRKCLGFINDEVKAGYATQGEYAALVTMFNQFMQPTAPAQQPQEPEKPSGADGQSQD